MSKLKDAVIIKAYATKIGNPPCENYAGHFRAYYIAVNAISCYYEDQLGHGIIELSNGRKFTGVSKSDLNNIAQFFTFKQRNP